LPVAADGETARPSGFVAVGDAVRPPVVFLVCADAAAFVRSCWSAVLGCDGYGRARLA
jgi:hypothetical protein